MNTLLEQEVRRRAKGRCEYCLLPEYVVPEPFQFDHIVAKQHGGQTDTNNLAVSCAHCNRYKGPNIAGIDAATGQVIPLFHPRRDHFAWNGPVIDARTVTGRVTVSVLQMNAPTLVAVRAALISEGAFPPTEPGS